VNGRECTTVYERKVQEYHGSYDSDYHSDYHSLQVSLFLHPTAQDPRTGSISFCDTGMYRIMSEAATRAKLWTMPSTMNKQ